MVKIREVGSIVGSALFLHLFFGNSTVIFVVFPNGDGGAVYLSIKGFMGM